MYHQSLDWLSMGIILYNNVIRCYLWKICYGIL